MVLVSKFYPKKSSSVDICSVFHPTAPITEDMGSMNDF
jgi:hypothetical protein